MQFPADLVTFSEEIRDGKLHFLYNVSVFYISWILHILLSRGLICSEKLLALLEMLRNPLLTGVTDLQPAVCTATKTRFFQNALKISENVRVEFCNGVLL